MQFNNPKYQDSVIEKSIFAILSDNNLLSLATMMGREPWINTAYFSYDDNLNLYVLTPKTTQHAKNLDMNGSVAVTVFDSHQAPQGAKKGLQIFGIAEMAKGATLHGGFNSYAKRFNWFRESIKSLDDFNKGIIESRIYVIYPKMIKIFDEGVFGEENWVTIRL